MALFLHVSKEQGVCPSEIEFLEQTTREKPPAQVHSYLCLVCFKLSASNNIFIDFLLAKGASGVHYMQEIR